LGENHSSEFLSWINYHSTRNNTLMHTVISVAASQLQCRNTGCWKYI